MERNSHAQLPKRNPLSSWEKGKKEMANWADMEKME